MAKRRILKKEISYVAGELFTEALVCKLYIPGVNQEKADALMARILDMQDSYIVRAGHPDGKDNKALVRNYYRKLREDLQNEVNAIADEIGDTPYGGVEAGPGGWRGFAEMYRMCGSAYQ